jgi:hypothetical protein
MVSKTKVRVKGKGLDIPCLICGEQRFTENAHFPKRKRIGEEGKETIPLCPTHHRLLEHGRLSRLEFEAVWKKLYAKQFKTIELFMGWAYENCYPYTINDMKKKFWDYSPNKE